MKKIISILSLFVLMAFAPKMLLCQEQDSIQQMELEMNLAELQQDLDQLSDAINTYDDIELYDYEMQEVGNRVKAFAVLIGKDNPQYDAYDQCNRSLYQIQKRIDALKEDYNHQKNYESLMGLFQNTIAQLSTYKEQGEQYIDDRKADSLVIIKKKAGNVYRKASTEAATQKDMVNNDETLSQLWDSIEEYNETIENMECSSMNKLYELIFRVVMVVAVLLLVFNMLQSKLKAAKMAKTAKKQMEDVMGANDEPVL